MRAWGRPTLILIFINSQSGLIVSAASSSQSISGVTRMSHPAVNICIRKKHRSPKVERKYYKQVTESNQILINKCHQCHFVGIFIFSLLSLSLIPVSPNRRHKDWEKNPSLIRENRWRCDGGTLCLCAHSTEKLIWS